MSIVQEFKEFAVKGSAVELAVGVVIGAAFGQIVTALVEDVIMPPVGMLLGGRDFSNLFLTLDGSEFDSLAAAKAAGAPLIGYGSFIQSGINFLIVAAAVFAMVKAMNRLSASLAAEAAAEPCAPAEEVVLLREIRDNLKASATQLGATHQLIEGVAAKLPEPEPMAEPTPEPMPEPTPEPTPDAPDDEAGAASSSPD